MWRRRDGSRGQLSTSGAVDGPRAEPTPAAPADGQDSRSPTPRPMLARFHWLLPWASLAGGVAGAVVMDRGPERAALVGLAAVSVFVLLTAVQWLLRIDPSARRLGPVRHRVIALAHYSLLFATQSIIQLDLFFSLPFYLQAASRDVGHIVFMSGLCLASAFSLWDPWTERLLRRPLLGPLLPALSSFVALNAVLPAIGLSTYQALWVASAIAAFGVAVAGAAGAPRGGRSLSALTAFVVALSIPLSLWLGATRILPAAPLRLVSAEIGVARSGKWIARAVSELERPPEHLICATAIASPIGVRDRLFHVWRKDGVERARIRLKIVGGRARGYRTQSRIGGFGPAAAGTYSCSVITASGQLLGTRKVRIARGATDKGG